MYLGKMTRQKSDRALHYDSRLRKNTLGKQKIESRQRKPGQQREEQEVRKRVRKRRVKKKEKVMSYKKEQTSHKIQQRKYES